MGGIIGVLLGAIITWTIPVIWSSLPARMFAFLGQLRVWGCCRGRFVVRHLSSLESREPGSH